MQTDILLKKLSKRFPKRFAKANHDYVGLMTGKKPKEVHKILLALDLDWEILDVVKKEMPDLIITHHPFIFGTRARVFKYDESKKALCEEIDKLGIPVYSYHTNFDTGNGGMNDALSAALGLKNVYAPLADPMMRIGELEQPMEIVSFATFAKQQLHVDYSLLINKGHNEIKKVGIIGGGGSRGWKLAMEEGCDIYISGDAPHHVRRDVVNHHFNYLDMPHEIEKIFMPTMKKLLLEFDDSLDIVIVDHEKLPQVI